MFLMVFPCRVLCYQEPRRNLSSPALVHVRSSSKLGPWETYPKLIISVAPGKVSSRVLSVSGAHGYIRSLCRNPQMRTHSVAGGDGWLQRLKPLRRKSTESPGVGP